MEAKEIMSKFDELYGMMASSTNVKYMHVFGNTMRCMMKNYLTKKEASEIVNGMNPSATWDMQTWLNAMTGLGLATEEKPYYNDYALYVAMNQVVSDHGCTIAKILGKDDVKDIGTEHLVKYANHLALDLLKDKDGVYDIREYFLK